MTAEVIPFPGHHWAHCTSRECTGCHLCHGGLAVCTVCGGMEGALTTECRGERLDMMFIDAVYAGLIDWRGGEWVADESPHSPGKKTRRET